MESVMSGVLSDPTGSNNDGTMIKDPLSGVYRTPEEHARQEAAVKNAQEALARISDDFDIIEFLRPLIQSW
jgi:hypothetical protein